MINVYSWVSILCNVLITVKIQISLNTIQTINLNLLTHFTNILIEDIDTQEFAVFHQGIGLVWVILDSMSSCYGDYIVYITHIHRLTLALPMKGRVHHYHQAHSPSTFFRSTLVVYMPPRSSRLATHFNSGETQRTYQHPQNKICKISEIYSI